MSRRVLSSVSVGTIIPAWYTLIGKTIHQAGLFGLGRGLAHRWALAGHCLRVTYWIVRAFPGICSVLSVGLISMMAFWLGLAITREPPDLTMSGAYADGGLL